MCHTVHSPLSSLPHVIHHSPALRLPYSCHCMDPSTGPFLFQFYPSFSLSCSFFSLQTFPVPSLVTIFPPAAFHLFSFPGGLALSQTLRFLALFLPHHAGSSVCFLLPTCSFYLHCLLEVDLLGNKIPLTAGEQPTLFYCVLSLYRTQA